MTKPAMHARKQAGTSLGNGRHTWLAFLRMPVAIAVLGVIAIQGTASAEERKSSAWWDQADKACDQALGQPVLEEVPALKSADSIQYQKEGHFNTTGTIAKMAGWKMNDAQVLACYSQMPDEVSRLEAVYIGKRYFFWRGEYHHLIMDILHSLHGGKAPQVEVRRERLFELVKENAQLIRREGTSDRDIMRLAWQTGFLIHALGDSYAHVKEPSGSAYGDWIGHAFAGHEPDYISQGKNFDRYEMFARKLYEALGGSIKSHGKLEEFIAKIKAAAASHHERDVKRAMEDFVVYPGGQVQDVQEGPVSRQGYLRDIPEADIKVFLRIVRQRLES